MKITSVEVFDCQINRHYPDMVMFEPILIRINTDEGISCGGVYRPVNITVLMAAPAFLDDLGPESG